MYDVTLLNMTPPPPAPLETLVRNNQTGLTDSTHSSTSSSAERYRLDEFDEAPILLYKYRGKLRTSSQKELCSILDKGERFSSSSASVSGCRNTPLPETGHYSTTSYRTYTDFSLAPDESLRVTKKLIPRGQSYVDVKRHDLYLDAEKESYAEYPNYDSSLASIKIPSLAYWSHMFFGNYEELYIVSPETSTNASVVDENESRRASPTATWAREVDERLSALASHGQDC